MKKRGQLQISFSMIFSIILIIAFVAVAFYAISSFLATKKCANLGQFKQDLQEEINRAWSSDESSFVFSKAIEAEICFIDLNKSQIGKNFEQYNSIKKLGYKANMFFYPLKICKGSVFNLEHVNLEKTTSKENPYCVSKKASIKIVKKFNEPKVCLGENC